MSNRIPAHSQAKSQVSVLHATAAKTFAFALSLALTAAGSLAFAQSENARFVRFHDFVENTRTASAQDFLARPDSKVRSAAAFEEMRKSILDRYQGVEIAHSFVMGNNHYDCVPVEQQPALRTYHLNSVADAPPLDLAPKAVTAHGNVLPASLEPESAIDDAGNSTHCEAKTVPLLRNTLETMSRFPTLTDFYRKDPGGAIYAALAHARQQAPIEGQRDGLIEDQHQLEAQGPRAEFLDPTVASHKYSFTYQYVNNHGGNNNNNIWDPYVNTAAGEVFSLSQAWYVGGSGSGLQTEEVGWVVYPAMFGDERSHFFIFSTPDNYSTSDPSHNCWDNTCDDFVQVADSGLLGAYFSTVSSAGGTQYDFSSEYYFYGGNWWLSYQGTWIGYYPGAFYKGGQNTKYAQIIEFGTEGVGTTLWPPEGSGAWPSTGWAHAAYQRNLWYIANSTTYASYWASLTPDIPSPACYNIAGPYSSTSSGWAVYFYEGGPGGSGC